MRTLRDRLTSESGANPLHLLNGRVHEAEGRGRVGFALFQAARLTGPIFWIMLIHDRDRPLPAALPDGVAERLHFIEARHETDLLWTVEETLRARPVSLVLAAPEKPISLTAGRRLQLAAEAGDTTGLMLIQEGRGGNAAETRWKCDPLPGAGDSTRHRWILNKNKRGTIGIHDVSWNGATAAVHLVPQSWSRSRTGPKTCGYSGSICGNTAAMQTGWLTVVVPDSYGHIDTCGADLLLKARTMLTREFAEGLWDEVARNGHPGRSTGPFWLAFFPRVVMSAQGSVFPSFRPL